MLLEHTVDLYSDGIGKVQFMGCSSKSSESRILFRIEKDSQSDQNKKFINYSTEHGQPNTFEHNLVAFKFVVPLFVRTQHMRYEFWNYNEINRGYTDKSPTFYCPNAFQTQHSTNRQSSDLNEIDPILYPDLSDLDFGLRCSQELRDHVKRSKFLFQHLLEAGISYEQASMVLPQNLYTEYCGFINESNLIKFIDLVRKEEANYEVRKIAEACQEILEEQGGTSYV